MIVIIALLLWAGNSPISRILRMAKKTEAASTCQTILNGLEQFQTDYRHLPRLPGVAVSGDTNTDTSAASGLMTILKGMEEEGKPAGVRQYKSHPRNETAKDEAENPQGADYLGDIKDAKTMSDGTYLSGLWRDGDKVALFDPWGHYYRIRLDSDGDGFVTDPRDATKKLPGPAVIWSIGKDGDPDTWDDNVIVPEK